MIKSKNTIQIVLFIFITSLSLNSYSNTITNKDLNSLSSKQQILAGPQDNISQPENQNEFLPIEIVYNLLSTANEKTTLSPDFWGTSEYSDYASLSHKVFDALAYNAAGYQSNAEKIIDFFIKRLNIPKDEIIAKKDTNDIYGILKIVSDESTANDHIALVEGISISDDSRSGKAQSHFFISPRSMALLISAMLNINKEKYKYDALKIGETLLAFQDQKTGAILDKDRTGNYTHTIEHISVYSAFNMLSEINDDPKWIQAAENAYYWFTSHVFNVSSHTVAQGFGKNGENNIYTTSAYTHFMLSSAADKLSNSLIKQLTDKVIKSSLCNVSINLPDNRWIQTTLADEYNPKDERVIEARGGLLPRASFEQSIYLILMLQKNAVRLKNHDLNISKEYKALAEVLIDELKKTFYKIDTLRGLTTFSDSRQNQVYIKLGANPTAITETVRSPYFYINDPAFPNRSISGATSFGSMFYLISDGINPFILNDDFADRYNRITVRAMDKRKAVITIKRLIYGKISSEDTPTQTSQDISISEPEKFNQQMWKHFSLAEKAKLDGDMFKSRRSYETALKWALKTADNMQWYLLARTDNQKKIKKHNGIIDYPFGRTFYKNENKLHDAIMHYPILNEMGAAMWAAATINYELTNRDEAKVWIKKIIENIPLHQIPSTTVDPTNNETLINGYWNALEAWEDNPNNEVRDKKMQSLYMEVLMELGIKSAKPKKVKI